MKTKYTPKNRFSSIISELEPHYEKHYRDIRVAANEGVGSFADTVAGKWREIVIKGQFTTKKIASLIAFVRMLRTIENVHIRRGMFSQQVAEKAASVVIDAEQHVKTMLAYVIISEKIPDCEGDLNPLAKDFWKEGHL